MNVLSIDMYHHYADLLADKNFQIVVQEIKHDIVGQDTFVVFIDKTIKVLRCCVSHYIFLLKLGQVAGIEQPFDIRT